MRRRTGLDWGIVLLIIFAEFSWLGLDFSDGRDLGQVYLKGMVYAALGAVAVFRIGMRRRLPGHLMDYLTIVFLSWAIFTSNYSPDPFLTFATATLSLAVFLYVRTSRYSATPKDLVGSVFTGLAITIVVSMFAYLVAPEQFARQTWHGITRTRGILGNPNALGRASASLLLLILLSLAQNSKKKKVIHLGLAVLATVLLVSSGSRGSIGSLIIVLMTVWAVNMAFKFNSLQRSIIGAGIALMWIAIFGTVAYIGDRIFEYVGDIAPLISRSGRVQEVLTLTGRTQLWSFIVGRIAENPLLGYGYRAGEVLIPSLWNQNGVTLPHAHNMYLEVAFSLGIPALILFLGILAWLVATNLRLLHKAPRSPERLGLILLIMLVGLLERSAIGNVTMYYVLLCVLITDTIQATTIARRFQG